MDTPSRSATEDMTASVYERISGVVHLGLLTNTHVHIEGVPAESGGRSVHFSLDLLLFFDGQFRQLMLVDLVSLFGRSWQDMQQSTLEMLSIQTLVGLYG